jgi:EAL domain-containing protein (putative c-di-GMP-specific phosphodiesterase class I)
MHCDALAVGPGVGVEAAEQRRACVILRDDGLARRVAAGLAAVGWTVSGTATDLAGAVRLLALPGPPCDLVVSGLRFDDGDGFQLMRLLARCSPPPPVFIASREQRAVIKAAAALAEACGVPVAGQVELPVDVPALLQELVGCARAPAVRAPRQAAPELTRDELLELLERSAVRPWVQPKWRLATAEVVGFEALMRAEDAQGRLVMPDRLVSALARHHLLDEATLHMARHTVDFVARCLDEGMAISASINVSMQSLSNLAFCQELAATVEHAGLDPSWITIEITETDAMADVRSVIENTGRIRMLGFNLAIDDFGTAYSSLLQLARIPFSELKIERAFITGIEGDAAKRAIVQSCAQLGAGLGLSVVAEGVETVSELAHVRQAGCTAVQGYLVSRPMPVPRALEWLRGLDEMRFTPA